jgi:ATP-dependent DNA ligase
VGLGEVCGPDGVAVFDALHHRGNISEAMLYAFDFLELDGEDLRSLSLGDRKKRLARLVGKRRLDTNYVSRNDRSYSSLRVRVWWVAAPQLVLKT